MENKKQVEYILKSPKKQGITNKIQKRIRKLSNIETLSIIEGGTYPQSVLDEILSKNIVKWFIDSHVGDTIIKKEGVARFASDNVYLYYKKQEDESSYKFYFLLRPDSKDSVVFYLNTIKKHKLI